MLLVNLKRMTALFISKIYDSMLKFLTCLSTVATHFKASRCMPVSQTSNACTFRWMGGKEKREINWHLCKECNNEARKVHFFSIFFIFFSFQRLKLSKHGFHPQGYLPSFVVNGFWNGPRIWEAWSWTCWTKNLLLSSYLSSIQTQRFVQYGSLQIGWWAEDFLRLFLSRWVIIIWNTCLNKFAQMF